MNELHQPYFQKLDAALSRRRAAGETIYPDEQDVFKAFRLTSLGELRVVILGQDPYSKPGEATGLCFGVSPEVPRPPSLSRIQIKVARELGVRRSIERDLTSWAESGVLLLNAVLTVAENEPGSHRGLGWECFTNRVIQVIDESEARVVFMLWGTSARQKATLIDRRHRVLEGAHPSRWRRSEPGYFTEANRFLRRTGREPVCWRIPPCGAECRALRGCRHEAGS